MKQQLPCAIQHIWGFQGNAQYSMNKSWEFVCNFARDRMVNRQGHERKDSRFSIWRNMTPPRVKYDSPKGSPHGRLEAHSDISTRIVNITTVEYVTVEYGRDSEASTEYWATLICQCIHTPLPSLIKQPAEIRHISPPVEVNHCLVYSLIHKLDWY